MADYNKSGFLDVYRDWLNPLGVLPNGLVDAILVEQGYVAAIAQRCTDRILIVPPTPDGGFFARAKPLDNVFEMFEIEIGSGVVTRLGLILRCLFDRSERGEPATVITAQFSDEAAARMPRRAAKDKLDPRYAMLVGADTSQPLSTLSWWTDALEFSKEESYEARNAMRYGYIFLLYHETAHILRRHFEGRESAEFELSPERFNAVQRGMEWDADVWALKNLIIYIENHIDLQFRLDQEHQSAGGATHEPNVNGFNIALTRGRHIRCAFFGIFAVLSMMNPLLWTNLDLDNEHYFHPVSRIAFAVRTLDLESFPTDGKAMFYAFDDLDSSIEQQAQLKDVPLLGVLLDGQKIEPTWNWSDFYMMALAEWDREAGTFLADMARLHKLRMNPYPFNFHRSGMEFAQETIQKLIEARNAALPFIKTEANFLVTREEFLREFVDMCA